MTGSCCAECGANIDTDMTFCEDCSEMHVKKEIHDPQTCGKQVSDCGLCQMYFYPDEDEY